MLLMLGLTLTISAINLALFLALFISSIKKRSSHGHPDLEDLLLDMEARGFVITRLDPDRILYKSPRQR